MLLPSIEHYDMLRLDCEDLKRGLSDEATGLANKLLDRVSADHRLENQAYVLIIGTFLIIGFLSRVTEYALSSTPWPREL